MQSAIGAIVFATFLWWFSTGVIFYLNARPTHTFRWSMLGGTLLLCAALYGLSETSAQDTVFGAFAAFTCGLVIWGWHTMSYYMGVITGPRREKCAPGCNGWRHFWHAVETSLYHELAIIATFALMAALTWNQQNQFGLWTFLVLWSMHVSAKLNVFLGVRNLNEEFIPKHLQYLTGFFRQRPMNLLFPFSVTTATIVTTVLIQKSIAPEADAFISTGFALLATLMALAVIEHWFMILPIPAEALWRWSLDPAPVRRESDDIGEPGTTGPGKAVRPDSAPRAPTPATHDRVSGKAPPKHSASA